MPNIACRHLRTKKLYVPSLSAEALQDKQQAGASAHCWCNKTMTEIGFDDKRVSVATCSPSDRDCYPES